jgi:hypothetical protein
MLTKTDELVAMTTSSSIMKSAQDIRFGLKEQTTARAKRMEGHSGPCCKAVFVTSRLTICCVLHIYNEFMLAQPANRLNVRTVGSTNPKNRKKISRRPNGSKNSAQTK